MTDLEHELLIIKNWAKLGFTEGFKNVRNLSLAFDIAAVNIINSGNEDIEYISNKLYSTHQYETLIFPVIRRIFEKNTDAFDMDTNKIEEEVKKIETEFKTYLSTIDIEAEKLINELIDVEAEVCACFCDEYDKFAK